MKKTLIALVLTAGLCANDFGQAVEEYKSGNYIQALNIFYALAKKDDVRAQYNVALIYANGLGVEQDLPQAELWYERAAKQGNASAQYNLAQLCHAKGAKDPHAYEKAKYWYDKSVNAGVKEAYNNLGSLYLNGQGVKKDEQKAFRFFQKGARKGDEAAKVNVAVLYAWGESVTHDKMKAYEYLKSALKAGKSEASGYLDKLCNESAWVCKD